MTDRQIAALILAFIFAVGVIAALTVRYWGPVVDGPAYAAAERHRIALEQARICK